MAGDLLELGDHVAREVAARGTRIGEHGLLVTALGGRERAARGEAVPGGGLALQGGEVVEQRRLRALRALRERGDVALAVLDARDDRVGVLAGEDVRLGAAHVAAAVGGLVGRLEGRVDQPVRRRLEGLDLLLAPHEDRERRRLHAAERDHGAAERGAAADRGRARRVHADEPVGLGARARRGLERRELAAGPQVAEGLADRVLGHRREPGALHRDALLAGHVEHVGEDQLALAPGVAGVHDQLDVVALHELGDRVQLLLGRFALGARHDVEALREDGQIDHLPALELVVVVLGRGQLGQVADRPGDDGVRALEKVLRGLERAVERLRDVDGDRLLLGDDQCDCHGSHASTYVRLRYPRSR